MNNSYSKKLSFSWLSESSSSKSRKKKWCYSAKSVVWNKLVPHTNITWCNKLNRSSKFPRKFSSKMVASIVMSRKSQSDARKMNSVEIKDRLAQPLSTHNPSLYTYNNYYVNNESMHLVQMNRPFHITHEKNETDKTEMEKLFESKPYSNGRLRNAETKRTCHCIDHEFLCESCDLDQQNEAAYCNSSDIISFDLMTVKPDEKQLNHQKYFINNNSEKTMTSDCFLPTYLDILHNNNQLPPVCASDCVSSDPNDNENELHPTDFVLNFSKDPCTDIHMKMSALELLTSHRDCVSSSESLISQDSTYNLDECNNCVSSNACNSSCVFIKTESNDYSSCNFNVINNNNRSDWEEGEESVDNYDFGGNVIKYENDDYSRSGKDSTDNHETSCEQSLHDCKTGIKVCSETLFEDSVVYNANDNLFDGDDDYYDRTEEDSDSDYTDGSIQFCEE